ncbi:MAG: PilZ domain-containing protein [Alphaproteobacteria bacterium]|nr:PilZ domain-containing protein [Alphaproteobacteria bacterium]
MPTIAKKLDRAESRRQQRYTTPAFDLIVECEMFRAVDWSAGGVHLDGVCEGAAVGTAVEGWITLPEASYALAFSGEVLRTDEATGHTVLRFDDIDVEVAEFLAKAAARRLH